jgi:O-antigen/teichoic acid export membrane protein
MSLLTYIAQKLNLSKTKEAILQNLFWSVTGKLFNLFSGLFVGIIIARYLGPKQYGLMNYVISYVFLFQTFALFGLDAIEIREEARAKVSYNTIIGTAFCIKLLTGLFFIATCIATSWYMETDMYTLLLVAIYSLTIVFNSLIVIRNYFTAIVQNEYVVKAEITRTMISIVFKITLLLVHASLTWFVFAFLLDFALVAAGYIVAYRTIIGRIRDWTFSKSYALFMLKESLPLLLTNAAVIIYQRIDQVMIGQMIDKESVGYFSVAARFTEVLIYIPMMLAQTITPILVQARERGVQEYLNKAQQFMNISLWLSLLASAFMSVSSYWLVSYTFGEAYLPAVAVLQVISFKAASVALSNTAGAMLVTEGLQRFAILRDGLGCLVCVALNYILLPRYGIMAAAFVSIASNVVAGYLADAFIPAYRHLFVRQTKALCLGWKDIVNIKTLLKS